VSSLQHVVATDGPPPVGPFSHAVIAQGLVFISGQVGFMPVTGQLVGEEFHTQCRRTFDNLALIAEAAGTDLTRTVRVGIYLKRMSDFAELNSIYMDYFSSPYPARTTVPSDLSVLIEADAVVALP
jgi:2-iminobutanoate/2-iminopropanoate deaminase